MEKPSYRQGTFRGAGGARLALREWRPAGDWHSTVVVVHGLGEHSGRYGKFAERLLRSGHRVCAFDLRGHGLSSGQRGFVRRWDEFISDVGIFLDLVSGQEIGKPIFLFGHSLGGLIALDFALKYPESLRGLVLSAPAIGETAISPFLWRLAAFMDKIFPRFSVSVLKHEKLNEPPQITEMLEKDPLTHSRGTARLAMEVRSAVGRLRESAPNIELPVLLLHGTSDLIASVEGSRWLATRLPASKTIYQEIAGGGHEVFNEEGIRERGFEALSTWLASRENGHEEKTYLEEREAR